METFMQNMAKIGEGRGIGFKFVSTVKAEISSLF